MNITGIIAEYNPLHSGHEHHINVTKSILKSDGTIGIISGNFVQRGIPAMIDKWNRTKMALLSGIDLVIELPVIYAVSSAEFFAFGAVSLLNALGGVTNISFGSELGEIEPLISIAKILNSEPFEFREELINNINQGMSYPTARSKALIKIYSSKLTYDINELFKTSNNILGIEYCKSILKLNSRINPFTINRVGDSYNSDKIVSEFTSATAIRKYLKQNKDISSICTYLPQSSYNIIKNLQESNYDFTFEDDMLPFIKHKYFATRNKFENLPDVTEGIDNKIHKAIEKYNNIDDVIQNVKSKRFTYSRISRILCQYFIGFDTLDSKLLRSQQCPYARILGFNNTGKSILKHLKKHTSIPIYTKLPKEINECISLDLNATKAYSIINKNINPNNDYLVSPIII